MKPVLWSCWLFDMDGTLTVPQHDFKGIRRQLGAPLDSDLLAWISRLAPGPQQEARSSLQAWEEAIAKRSQAQQDALALLEHLAEQGADVGVITRNTYRNALITLEAAGLDSFFEPDRILGRDSAPPKPDPGGLQLLMQRMGSEPSSAVMVGDWSYDIEAGIAAGTATILVERSGAVLGPEPTLRVQSLLELPWLGSAQ